MHETTRNNASAHYVQLFIILIITESPSLTMLHEGDSHDGINHGLISMFKAHRAHTGVARHLIVHRLPYSITRNKGLNSPQVDTWVHRAPSAGNIGIINTRATARFAQSHLPQGNGIQDRQISSIYRFQMQVTFRTHIREGDPASNR